MVGPKKVANDQKINLASYFFLSKNDITCCSLKLHMTLFIPQKNGARVQTRVELRSYNCFLQTSYIDKPNKAIPSITTFLTS